MNSFFYNVDSQKCIFQEIKMSPFFPGPNNRQFQNSIPPAQFHPQLAKSCPPDLTEAGDSAHVAANSPPHAFYILLFSHGLKMHRNLIHRAWTKFGTSVSLLSLIPRNMFQFAANYVCKKGRTAGIYRNVKSHKLSPQITQSCTKFWTPRLNFWQKIRHHFSFFF